METEVIHCKNQAAVEAAGDRYIYIGRPTKWGNPYSHKYGTRARYKVDSREIAVQKYEDRLLNNKDLMNELSTLKGMVLGCWCHPKACHGHVLAKYADRKGMDPDIE